MHLVRGADDGECSWILKGRRRIKHAHDRRNRHAVTNVSQNRVNRAWHEGTIEGSATQWDPLARRIYSERSVPSAVPVKSSAPDATRPAIKGTAPVCAFGGFYREKNALSLWPLSSHRKSAPWRSSGCRLCRGRGAWLLIGNRALPEPCG